MAKNNTSGLQSKCGLRKNGGKADCSFHGMRFVKADADEVNSRMNGP